MNVIQHYLEDLAKELGASRLSLLLCTGEGAQRRSALYHAGADEPSGQPIPELIDLESAEHLVDGALASSRVDQFQSADKECVLLFVPRQRRYSETGQPERRQAVASAPGYWLGLRFPSEPVLSAKQRETLGAGIRIAAALFNTASQRSDSETGLPDRGEFERTLHRVIERSVNFARLEDGSGSGGFAALLVQPRTLPSSRAQGMLPGLAEVLKDMLRDSDQLYRYGATTLALPLPGVDPAALKGLCHKLAAGLNAHSWPGGEPAPQWHLVAMHCATADAGNIRNIDVAARLDTALRHCQMRSGNQIDIFSADEVSPALPAEGLFTGEPIRDYRNMGLLWRLNELIGASISAGALMVEAVDEIGVAFDCPVALFERSPEAVQRIASSGHLPDQPTAIAGLLARSNARAPTAETIDGNRCVVVAGSDRADRESTLTLVLMDPRLLLTAQDESLLLALCAQLSRAVDRLKIAAQESGLREQETRQLRQQLAAAGSGEARQMAVYESNVMAALFRQAKNWSRTEETILITGESGAGKEIMAHRVHQESSRAAGPLVTVDCAAIPDTLLEAELFGRIKGAYTGADSASEGYVRKAAGGTLFLDEIGELPIEVQAKLLRFVQEKQISPVGSSEHSTVDVRIIAATNRNLESEVKAGRFRADLMYRLRVLELRLPPLRERQEDIVPLAEHFLNSYNAQYQRQCEFSPAAAERLRSYAWPGNVRELKHSILKACLECSDERIEPGDIGFSEDAAPQANSYANAPRATMPADVAQPAVPSMSASSDGMSLEACWQAVEESLRASCQRAIADGLRLPFGSWISDSLVKAADEQAQGVAKHAAALVGLPESTFRRQLERVRQAEASGLNVTHRLFGALPEQLAALLAQTVAAREASSVSASSSNLIEDVRRRLLRMVSDALPDQGGYAAALMGVTPPTYRRHLKALENAQAQLLER